MAALTQNTPAGDTDQPYAALDLGSNSFHLIVAYDHGDRLQVVDRHKETVRLAEGLAADNSLAPTVVARALACLKRLGQRVRDLPPGNVRVVGTNTLRKARNSQDFIDAAERALGHRVEIIGGREEARLIYLGVSHSLEPLEDSAEVRLVVDIGGGSTELILGRQFQPHLMESLHMGCVSMSATHFPDGRLRQVQFVHARNIARQELEVIEEIYRARGWDTAIGASGTLLAIHDAILELTGERGITADGLRALEKHLVQCGHIDDIDLESIDAERAPVLPGGLAITSAIVDALGVDSMTVSDGALREGLLHDLLGRVHAHDIRETTVADLMRRYHVDTDHARRVATTVAKVLEQVSWDLAENLAGDVPPIRQHPKKRAPPTAYPALPPPGCFAGAHFCTRSEWTSPTASTISMAATCWTTWTCRDSHARSSTTCRCSYAATAASFRSRNSRDPPSLIALCVLLRLAVVLHRGRSENALPAFWVAPTGDGEIRLTFPKRWLAEHPLTRLDLEQESEYLAVIPLKLAVASI